MSQIEKQVAAHIAMWAGHGPDGDNSRILQLTKDDVEAIARCAIVAYRGTIGEEANLASMPWTAPGLSAEERAQRILDEERNRAHFSIPAPFLDLYREALAAHARDAVAAQATSTDTIEVKTDLARAMAKSLYAGGKWLDVNADNPRWNDLRSLINELERIGA